MSKQIIKKKISYNNILLENIDEAYKELRQTRISNDLFKERNFKTISTTLDNFYFYNKLRLYCTQLNYSLITNKEEDVRFQEELNDLKKILELNSANKHANIHFEIYLKVKSVLEIRMLETKDLTLTAKEKKQNEHQVHQFLEDILALMVQKENQFSRKEQLEVYSYLTSYCIKKVNQGNLLYAKKYIQIMSQMLAICYGSNRNQIAGINSNIFRNIVIIALKINDPSFFKTLNTPHLIPKNKVVGIADKYEWSEKFIAFYKHKIKDKYIQCYEKYCIAYLQFHKQDFVNAYHTIKAIKPIKSSKSKPGPTMNLNNKVLEFLIYFELYLLDLKKANFLKDDDSDYEKMIHAFEQMLRRYRNRKLLTYQLRPYEDFLSAYKKLYKFRTKTYPLRSYDKAYATKVQQLTAAFKTNKFPNKDWFDEKVEQMEKR